MSTEDTRTKIISFRLSDAEYRAVEAASRINGFASVSLFARSAALGCDSGKSVHTPLDVDINRLWRRIEVLTTKLDEMTDRVAAVLDRFGTN
jgi:hypothetical protein